MAWTKTQTGIHVRTASGTSINAVFASNPTAGNVVCLAGFYASGGTVTAQDSNGNNYTQPSNSPQAAFVASWPSFCLYLIAPANASKTITISVSGVTSTISVFADEFTPPSGTAAFDNSAKGGATAGASPITSPNINASAASELLYEYAGNPSSNNFNGTGSGWTTNDAGAGANGDIAGYQLNGASGNTAVNFTAPGSNNVNTVAMSFKTTSASAFEYDIPQNRNLFILPENLVQQKLYDDAIPAGSLYGQPEEYYFYNPVAMRYEVNSTYQQGANDEQFPLLHGTPNEEYWINSLAQVPATLLYTQQFLFDEQISAGSLFGVPNEEYWQNPTSHVPCVMYQMLPYPPDGQDFVSGTSPSVTGIHYIPVFRRRRR